MKRCSVVLLALLTLPVSGCCKAGGSTADPGKASDDKDKKADAPAAMQSPAGVQIARTLDSRSGVSAASSK